jgi:hypothetical protein
MTVDYGGVRGKVRRKDLSALGSFEEGTTPNTCRFEPSQGQGRRTNTESRPPGTRLLKASEGLGQAMLLGRSADSDKDQSTHKQLSFTLVPTVREFQMSTRSSEYACTHACSHRETRVR